MSIPYTGYVYAQDLNEANEIINSEIRRMGMVTLGVELTGIEVDQNIVCEGCTAGVINRFNFKAMCVAKEAREDVAE